MGDCSSNRINKLEKTLLILGAGLIISSLATIAFQAVGKEDYAQKSAYVALAFAAAGTGAVVRDVYL